MDGRDYWAKTPMVPQSVTTSVPHKMVAKSRLLKKGQLLTSVSGLQKSMGHPQNIASGPLKVLIWFCAGGL